MLKSFLCVMFLNFSFALAQTESAATAAPAAPAAWMQFVPFLVIMVIFYFFLIRPQAKKQKEQENFLNALKTGDQIITQSGILGKITGINDHIVNLEIAQGVQIKMMKTQVLASQNSLQSKNK